MSCCSECAYWSECERDCYGTRWGRCTTERGKVFTLESELNDITAENADACLVFEPLDKRKAPVGSRSLSGVG
mgnify:CR=1 FL=1|jgi:hypothetical protein